MKHIFIDANIFVSFFEIKSDNLSELEKLVGLVKSKAGPDILCGKSAIFPLY